MEVRERGRGRRGWKTHIVPAVEGPEAGVDGYGPAADVGGGVVEPALGLPVVGCVARVGQACCSDHDADDGDADQGKELEEHEDVGAPCAQLCRDAVQQGDEEKSCNSNALVNPRACLSSFSAHDSSYNVLSKDNSNDSGRARLQDHDSAPCEQKARPLPEYFTEIDLRASVQRYRTSQLRVACSACPG